MLQWLSALPCSFDQTCLSVNLAHFMHDDDGDDDDDDDDDFDDALGREGNKENEAHLEGEAHASG